MDDLRLSIEDAIAARNALNEEVVDIPVNAEAIIAAKREAIQLREVLGDLSSLADSLNDGAVIFGISDGKNIGL